MFETVNREARLFARKGRSLRIPPPFSPTTPLQPMRLRERKIAPPPGRSPKLGATPPADPAVRGDAGGGGGAAGHRLRCHRDAVRWP
ncbi:MAG: hypothetical protein IPI02_13175 [Sterolibacteriaceae bacterium]|nr:hypothetical protein [Sterolibacteriaceae bacterium]